ncbi:MAG: hypothetical protein RLY97_1509 [Pseudomonadota bacterium]|jgi:hypothetical protein
MQQSGTSWSSILPVVIFALVMVMRFRKVGRPRPFRAWAMWTVPVIYSLVVVMLFVFNPPSLIGWGLFFGGLALGAALGWQRGKMMHLARDPATGKLQVSQSRAAMFLILGIFAIRYLARQTMGGDFGNPHSAKLHLITDAMMGFALGLISLQRIELALRAKNLPAIPVTPPLP